MFMLEYSSFVGLPPECAGSKSGAESLLGSIQTVLEKVLGNS
jgi:hypothetical protein